MPTSNYCSWKFSLNCAECFRSFGSFCRVAPSFSSSPSSFSVQCRCWLCNWRWHRVDKTQNFDYNAAEQNQPTHTHTHWQPIHTECRMNLCSMFAPEVGNLLCALSSNDYFISFEWQKIELIRYLVGGSTDARSIARIAVHISYTPTRMKRRRECLRLYTSTASRQMNAVFFFLRLVSEVQRQQIQNDMSLIEDTRPSHRMTMNEIG